jgi:hypothetical protein
MKRPHRQARKKIPEGADGFEGLLVPSEFGHSPSKRQSATPDVGASDSET